MEVFFSESDYRTYVALLARQAHRHRLGVWSYCLMPNHVHLVVTPSTENGLARPLGEAHRRYAELVNRRHDWTDHLWQERFASCPMDERHLRAAIRYVLLNPVRAGLVEKATDWPFSSASAHALGGEDPLLDRGPADARVGDWESFLDRDQEVGSEIEALRRHSRIGRPLGSEAFIDRLERSSGRRLRPLKGGRRRSAK